MPAPIRVLKMQIKSARKFAQRENQLYLALNAGYCAGSDDIRLKDVHYAMEVAYEAEARYYRLQNVLRQAEQRRALRIDALKPLTVSIGELARVTSW